MANLGSTVYPPSPVPQPSGVLYPVSANLTFTASSATQWLRLFANKTADNMYVDSLTFQTGAAITNTGTIDAYTQTIGSDPASSPLTTVGTQVALSTSNDVEGATMTLSTTQADRIIPPNAALWVKVVGSTLTAAPLCINGTIRVL